MAILLAVWALGCERQRAKEVPRADTAPEQRLAVSRPGAERLNVILITIDTLRADRLSCFGSDVRTPHLDRLASEGLLFTNASTTVPFTLPAHSSIMTGTYPPFHGVRENVGYYLSEDNLTLAQILGEAGWQTAGFVSAFVLDSRWGIGRGFEHYFDDFDLGAFEDANLGSVQRPGSETLAAALGWLDRRDSQRPFFLWLHLFDPHDPYTPPEPYRSQYPGRPYDAEVAYTDQLIGEFIDQLERRDLLDRSALVVTADHGEGLGDHDETFHGYFIYDSTVHVPLILRLPDGDAAGQRFDTAVSHVDIVPTVLEITGQPAPERLHGRSLLSVLDDAGDSRVYTESFYPLLHDGWAPLRSLRSATHKYIESPTPELFDLKTDPGEANSLFASEPGVGRVMARALLDLAERLEEGAATAAAPDLDEQTLAQLRALGYMAGPSETTVSGYDPSVPRQDPKAKIHLHRQLMRAQGRVSAGDDDEAARLLRQALAEDPELIDAHQLLGNIELAGGRAETAAGHFERALALDDRHKPSLFGLATSHQRLDRLDQALLGFHRLLDIAGQDSKATLAIADIEVERGDLAAAESALKRAATPGAPALLFNRLGEVQALSNRPTEARLSFEQAIASNPRLSQPHFNLAVLAEGSGDFEQARSRYETAIDLAPRHYQAQFNLGRLVGKLGDRGRERELLELAIVSKPDFAIGHFFLGKALMEAGELERAEAVSRAGLAILEESQLGWFVLADILNRRGRPTEAAQAVARGKSLAR